MNQPQSIRLIDDAALVRIYQQSPESSDGKSALEEILQRHNKLLMQLANNAVRAYPHIGTFSDFLQYARLGCASALLNFDESKNTKVTSYIWMRVYNYLKDTADFDGLIRCPSNCRAMRSYLRGAYDHNPEKKAKFEQENQIAEEEHKQAARLKYALLLPSFISLDGHPHDAPEHDGFMHEVISATCAEVTPPSISIESDIIDKIELDLAMKKLTPRQRGVIQHWFYEEMTMEETAQALGIGINEVRSDIKSIRTSFKRTLV